MCALAFILGGSIGVKADSVMESISAYLDHSIKTIFTTTFSRRSEETRTAELDKDNPTVLANSTATSGISVSVDGQWDPIYRILRS